MVGALRFLSTAEVGTMLTIAAGGLLTVGAFFPKLRTARARHGIVSLELAPTRARAEAVIASWRDAGLLGAARRSVLIDVPFVVLYSVALAAIGVLAGRAAGDEDAAGTLALMAAAAGVLDLLENAGLWALLHGRAGRPVPALTTVASAAKWLLIAAVLGGSVLTLVR